MRVHRLSVTAFGPYAGTETVDFDELNDSGIFLVTGPTGAGKTSILDAICFALYGVVPGVRDVKTLRSHHADDQTRPEVVLDVTLGDRRYRVRRSPEWHRPKKRGSGSTKEPARATLLEIADDGTERLVSSRIAEVGHELCLALGMHSEQFMQVVLLPQGEFQTFLRASSDERQGVLERLFRTQRFSRIEHWMREHTRRLAHGATTGERQVSQVLGALAHRSPVPVPEDLAAALDRDQLGDVAAAARQWAAVALATTRADLLAAEQGAEAADVALRHAETEERLALLRDEARRRRRAAQTLLAELDDQPGADEDEQRLHDHEAASRLRAVLAPLEDLEDDLRRAVLRRDHAVGRLATLPVELRAVPPDDAGLEAARTELAGRLARLSVALPREVELLESAERLDDAARHVETLEDEARGQADRAAALPRERSLVETEVSEARTLVGGVDQARQARAEATARLVAAESLPAARHRHDRLREEHTTAREAAADARAHHLDVVERRLHGMAAELAGQLAPDQPCSVCGSTSHPRLAAAATDAVTEHEQGAAAAQEEDLRAEAELLGTRVREAADEVRRLEGFADGRDAGTLRQELEVSERAVADAEAASARLPDLEKRLRALLSEETAVAGRLQRLAEEVTTGRTRLAVLESTISTHRAEVRAALGDAGVPPSEDGDSTSATLAEAVGALQAAMSVVTGAQEALDAVTLAADRWHDAVTRADEVAADAGLGSAEDARNAVLPPAEADRLRAGSEARREQRQAASSVLDDAALQEHAVSDGPDLEAARATLVLCRDEHRLRTSALGSARDAADAVTSLAGDLEQALVAWEPARQAHDTAEGMSRLVRGLGSDNQLQMRLSSYVLATRLDQVLDAANERLSHLRDQRYTLRRCGATRGNARAGLGLEVLDDWTGEARTPSTLSGGETFVVSLSLALGLADVVAHESGGLRVDTLFIDEGFGMLDPDTLDDVMDRIDALRAGGRTVGVVSHVTELRGRIPTQVHVSRGRDGSTVQVRTLVA